MCSEDAVHSVCYVSWIEVTVFICFIFDKDDGFIEVWVASFVIYESLDMVKNFFVGCFEPLSQFTNVLGLAYCSSTYASGSVFVSDIMRSLSMC